MTLIRAGIAPLVHIFVGPAGYPSAVPAGHSYEHLSVASDRRTYLWVGRLIDGPEERLRLDHPMLHPIVVVLEPAILIIIFRQDTP